MTSGYQPLKNRTHGIALCLSGGGFRAALFHLGSLRRLNESQLLPKVETITSVSGGSIASALLAKYWPTFNVANGIFTNFASYETALRQFCTRDIRTGPLIWDRLDPKNWPMLVSDDHSATDLLAQQYEDHLVPGLTLGDLVQPPPPGKPMPNFIFAASNLQTGVSFEQCADHVGDYQIGYANLPEMRVSDAVAASSAFPIAFPPLILKFESVKFGGGKLGNSDLQRQLARRIVLTDGGVYDNLGLEPVWKTHSTVLCSDGGKPFGIVEDPGEIITSRLLRAQDVIGNQALALRKRWLVASFENGLYGGSYWGIATEIEGYPHHGTGYSGNVLAQLRKVRTDLNPFTDREQLVLMNHGWALTDAALRSYCTSLVGVNLPEGNPPDLALLNDPNASLKAIGG